MISTVIRGGVGNQMFQIAAAYALALNNNDECAFDMNIKRTYHGVVHQGRAASCYFNSLYRNIKQLPADWKSKNKYIEPEGSPYAQIPYKEDLLLFGYFQSDKYFEGQYNAVRSLFTDSRLIDLLWGEYRHILSDSVAIHVRRGDYIKFPDVHTILDISYYRKALEYLRKRTNIHNIVVFSDDIPWCREYFKEKNTTFIEREEDHEEMYLMSLCTHNIISNSTFSWWGAFLNINEDKIVVAPKRWFAPDCTHEWEKIYTKDMIII